jgi:hypothetical protein
MTSLRPRYSAILIELLNSGVAFPPNPTGGLLQSEFGLLRLEVLYSPFELVARASGLEQHKV